MLFLSTISKIRIASILSTIIKFFYCYIIKLGSIIIIKRNEVKFEVDLNEGIDLAIYLNVYEYSTTKAFTKIIKPGSIVFDIGANIGAHTLYLAKLVGEKGRVYAFEPTKYALSKLQRNINLNNDLSKLIIVEQIMLSDNDQQLPSQKIYSSWPLTKTCDVHKEHLGVLQSTDGCCLMTLDTYFEQMKLSSVDFIKIDVDGFDYKVLKGASNILKKHKPVILMEIAPYLLEENGNSLIELIELIKENNYDLYNLGNIVDVLSIKSLLSIPSGKSINVIAR